MIDNVLVDCKSAIPKFPESILKKDTDRLDEINFWNIFFNGIMSGVIEAYKKIALACSFML